MSDDIRHACFCDDCMKKNPSLEPSKEALECVKRHTVGLYVASHGNQLLVDQDNLALAIDALCAERVLELESLVADLRAQRDKYRQALRDEYKSHGNDLAVYEMDKEVFSA